MMEKKSWGRAQNFEALNSLFVLADDWQIRAISWLFNEQVAISKSIQFVSASPGLLLRTNMNEVYPYKYCLKMEKNYSKQKPAFHAEMELGLFILRFPATVCQLHILES